MKIKLKIILTFLFTAILFISCKEKPIKLNEDITFNTRENISYGSHPEQKMDLYIPKDITGNPDVFIVIHGGGWRGGEKSQLTFFALSMMQKFPNAVFANIDYRLASTSRFALPNQIDDIATAIHFLEKQLKYKPKFILLGNSAGGHLSMLYAYKFDKDKKVKAVINIVGPADLSDSGFQNYDDYSFVEKHLIDPQTVAPHLSLMEYGSPVQWASPASPPTLSYYGTKDNVVPLSQKKILDSVLAQNNIMHESYEFNGDHISWEKPPHATDLINKIDLFLKRLNKNQMP